MTLAGQSARGRPVGAVACLGRLALGTILLAQGACAWVQGRDEAAAPAAAPLVAVEIEGVEKALADNLRAHLSVAAETCDAPRWRMERQVRRVEKEAGKAMRAFGFYESTLTKQLERGDECWKLQLSVTPGEPVRIGAVKVELAGEAAEDPAFGRLLETLPVREGDVLHHGHYESAKQAIESLAAERGYLGARFTRRQLEVDPAARTATVDLAFDSGGRYRLGRLTVEQDTLDPDLVDRFIDYPAGEPYDSGAVLRVNRALADSGYFGSVDVRPRVDRPEAREIPVDVRLTPRKPHVFSGGVGITTDTGPRARLGYENRRLNRRGHRAVARTTVSFVEQEVTGKYRIPMADPRSEWLSFDAGFRHVDTGTAESDAFKVGVSQTKQRFSDWLETRFVEWSQEDFEVGTQKGRANLLVPGVGWVRSVSDDRLRATRGYRVELETRVGAEALLSDTSFGRVRFATTWLATLPWGDRLIARGELGALVVDQFERLPPSLRFFAGGDTSVRGYGFKDLGPEDARGDVIGGRYLAVASLEYEHPVTASWGVAAFIDMGNAFDDESFNDGINTGIGAGVRWYSPIGPVRLDLAHPLDDDDVFRIHLRLGPDL
jgi:translocation and assembly module TamA